MFVKVVGRVNYASIRTCDIANGEGVRVTLFVSGCTHHCKGCFNPDQWDFGYGEPFTREVEDEILKDLEPSFISGLTILGGEPMEPANQRALVPFLRRFEDFRRKTGDKKTLWVYTGCVFEDDLCGGETHHSSDRFAAASPVDNPPQGAAENRGGAVSAPSRWRTEVTDEFLSYIDVLVDGPFVEELKDISLKFRCSSNKRMLRLKKPVTA